MPITTYHGWTFVVYTDIAGFKAMMTDGNRGPAALDALYSSGYYVIAQQSAELPRVEGLFVSDCGILFVRDGAQPVNRLEALLGAVEALNRRCFEHAVSLTTAIAWGEFSYRERIEIPGIEKNPVYGNAYVAAFRDNEVGTPKLFPNDCRILKQDLPPDVIDLCTGGLGLTGSRIRQTQNHFYFEWMRRGTEPNGCGTSDGAQMKPSFFTLFKRGRYYRPPDASHNSGDDSVLRGTMKEAERFAAAALAFAWKHDDAVRLHIWKTVCHFPGDPPLSRNAEIFVEPEHWADLLVVNFSGKRRIVYAIECKIGAALQARQDPSMRAFFCNDGYGALLTRSCGATDAIPRFIVLGFSKALNFQACASKLPLKSQQRSWENFARQMPTSLLARDLKLSLGRLGIGAFPATHTKAMKVNLDSSELGHAISVINEVQRRLNWQSRRQCTRTYDVNDDGWFMGVDLYGASSKNAEALKRLIKPPRRYLSWFGYEGIPGSLARRMRTRLTVWLHCGSSAHQQELAEHLRPRLRHSCVERVPADGRYFSVTVTAKASRSTDDVSWFSSVFLALGLKLRP